MLFSSLGLIDEVIQAESSGINRLAAHLTAPHTLADGAPALHLIMDILSQARAPVAIHHVGGGDVPYHPVDAAVTRDARLDVCDQVDQLFGCIRAELAAL